MLKNDEPPHILLPNRVCDSWLECLIAQFQNMKWTGYKTQLPGNLWRKLIQKIPFYRTPHLPAFIIPFQSLAISILSWMRNRAWGHALPKGSIVARECEGKAQRGIGIGTSLKQMNPSFRVRQATLTKYCKKNTKQILKKMVIKEGEWEREVLEV